MMKMIMRLNKKQVPSIVKKTTPGVGTFNRNLYIMAGYTDFDMVIVGAGGGNSGNAMTDTNNTGLRGVMYRSGGGGGGSLHLSGKLLDLPDLALSYSVGAKGSNGADAVADAKAPNGGAGGNSAFYTWVANGGGGAIGGDYSSTIRNIPMIDPHIVDVQSRGEGGDGGGNSSALGAGGVGGLSAMYERTNTSTPTTAGVNPTAGTHVNGGEYPVTGGGKGGGGGAGRARDLDGSPSTPADAGATGASGGPGPGPGVAASGSYGGGGGGASLMPVTAVAEYAGAGGQDGAVAFALF